MNLVAIHRLLTAVVFAAVAVGQIAGFAQVFCSWVVLPAAALVGALSVALLAASERTWRAAIEPAPAPKWCDAALLATALVAVGAVAVWRMVTWPLSELGASAPWDFFAYHGVKILDLVRSGSMWDLTIPFGQYPNGYETLAATLWLAWPDLPAVGMVHALLTVWLWSTLSLLVIRWSGTSAGIATVVAIAVMAMPLVYSQVVVVGKNDVMASTAVLTAVLFAPIGGRRWHATGLAAATAIALATKPTAVVIVGVLWLLALPSLGGAGARRSAAVALAALATALGSLWIVRNLVVIGGVFTSEVTQMLATSILAHLGDPELYASGSESFGLLVAAVTMIGLTAALLRDRRFNRPAAVLLWTTAGAFLATPYSAFSAVRESPLDIQWRFTLHGVLLVTALVLALTSRLWRPVVDRLVHRPETAIALCVSVAGVTVTASGIAVLGGDDPVLDPARAAVFSDPFGDRESVYDAVRREPEIELLLSPHGNMVALMLGNPELEVTRGMAHPLGRPDLADHRLPDAVLLVAGEPPGDQWRRLRAQHRWGLVAEDATGSVWVRVDHDPSRRRAEQPAHPPGTGPSESDEPPA